VVVVFILKKGGVKFETVAHATDSCTLRLDR